jgi:hypothetical protein
MRKSGIGELVQIDLEILVNLDPGNHGLALLWILD